MPKGLHHDSAPSSLVVFNFPQMYLPENSTQQWGSSRCWYIEIIYQWILSLKIMKKCEKSWCYKKNMKFAVHPVGIPWFSWVFSVHQTSPGEDEDDEDLADLPPLRCIRPKMTAESKFQIGQKADMGDRPQIDFLYIYITTWIKWDELLGYVLVIYSYNFPGWWFQTWFLFSISYMG